MSVRFPYHGSSRHEAAPPPGPESRHEIPRPGLPPATLGDIPGRACCCPAKPMVKVVMPPSGTRALPVDLWLCGHHWRASRARLTEMGAAACDVSRPAVTAGGPREGVPV